MLKTLKGKIATGVAVIGSSIGAAHAELPTEATDAITAIGADGEAMVAAAWPILATLTGAFIVMKIFKKAANRAA